MIYEYEKGDKVRITDGKDIRGYTGSWVSDMEPFVGDVTTITERLECCGKPAYKLESAGGFTYDERGLERIASKRTTKKYSKPKKAVANKCIDMPEIKNVVFNNPLTIIIWGDGTKTFVKCGDNDVYDPEKGMAMAIVKKAYGNKYKANNVIGEWVEKRSAK